MTVVTLEGCDDGNVRFWNIDTLDASKELSFVIKGHEMRVTILILS